MANKYKQMYLEYRKGKSLRKLAKLYGISKSQLSVIFRREFGEDYTTKKNNFGLIPIIKEHINSLQGKKRKEVERWLKENEDRLYEDAYENPQSKLYTDKQMFQKTYSECGKHCDLKQIIERTY